MLMLCLNETIGQLTMANNISWHGHLLTGGFWSCLDKGIDLEVENYKKTARPERTWKKQAEEESINVGLNMEDSLC